MCRPAKKLKMTKALNILRSRFKTFNDPRQGLSQIALEDFLMSSYAVFSLKYPSLLSFERKMDEGLAGNTKSMFGIKELPSDTHLRDVIDEVSPKDYRKIFTELFSEVQRSKLLDNFQFMEYQKRPYYLIAGDGTGYFSSHKVRCDQCLTYNEEDKEKATRFGHQVFAASLVHPERKEVFSFCPEAITKQDGKNKNDCEMNAFKRFIKDFRREHPKLNVIITLDALYANAEVIKLLNEHNILYIIAVKTKPTLRRQVRDEKKVHAMGEVAKSYQRGDKVIKTTEELYRYTTNLKLNQDKNSPEVHYVEMTEIIYWQDLKKEDHEKVTKFSWITNIYPTRKTVIQIAKGGRTRWKIENETFNTLKNQGYHLEHNYGHGKKSLSINLINMMFIAFLIDQIQQAGCQTFKKALQTCERKSYFWNKIINTISAWKLRSWDDVYSIIIGQVKMEYNTS